VCCSCFLEGGMGTLGISSLCKKSFYPPPQIKAMLSLDSLGGGTGEKEVFFIGGLIHPSLAQRSRRFSEGWD